MCEKGTLGNANSYYVPCSSQKTKVSKVSQKIAPRESKVSNFLGAFVLEIKYVRACYVICRVLVGDDKLGVFVPGVKQCDLSAVDVCTGAET